MVTEVKRAAPCCPGVCRQAGQGLGFVLTCTIAEGATPLFLLRGRSRPLAFYGSNPIVGREIDLPEEGRWFAEFDAHGNFAFFRFSKRNNLARQFFGGFRIDQGNIVLSQTGVFSMTRHPCAFTATVLVASSNWLPRTSTGMAI